MVGDSMNYTNMVLRMIDKSVGIDTVNEYVDNVRNRNFVEMKSIDDVNLLFNNSIDNFLSCLSYNELMNLRSYTGYNYKFINALLRNKWTYEELGLLDNDKKQQFIKLSREISGILNKFDTPDIDFMCFRGTKIDAFKDYGITNLSELVNLKDRYLYESAFTSTSILSESSYFNNPNLDEQYNCNIEIRYLIPSESNDGALLTSDDTSYSTGQNEFLLNSGMLGKVIDVSINDNFAILTVVLVPKKIYELTYDKGNNVRR